jgi:hypothetical protein
MPVLDDRLLVTDFKNWLRRADTRLPACMGDADAEP